MHACGSVCVFKMTYVPSRCRLSLFKGNYDIILFGGEEEGEWGGGGGGGVSSLFFIFH